AQRAERGQVVLPQRAALSALDLALAGREPREEYRAVGDALVTGDGHAPDERTRCGLDDQIGHVLAVAEGGPGGGRGAPRRERAAAFDARAALTDLLGILRPVQDILDGRVEDAAPP